MVVCGSVLLRSLFNAPVEWADDVARGLMVGSSFFGAASALARSENLGVAFFIDMLPAGIRRVVDAMGALLVAVISGYVAFNAIKMGWLTTGQTSGSGLPLEWTFYPMGAGALFMTVFAVRIFCDRPVRDMIAGVIATALIAGLYLAWDFLAPASVPSSGTLMLIGFFITLFGGLPIGLEALTGRRPYRMGARADATAATEEVLDAADAVFERRPNRRVHAQCGGRAGRRHGADDPAPLRHQEWLADCDPGAYGGSRWAATARCRPAMRCGGDRRSRWSTATTATATGSCGCWAAEGKATARCT